MARGSLDVTIIGDIFQGPKRAEAMGYNASVPSTGTATYPLIGGASDPRLIATGDTSRATGWWLIFALFRLPYLLSRLSPAFIGGEPEPQAFFCRDKNSFLASFNTGVLIFGRGGEKSDSVA